MNINNKVKQIYGGNWGKPKDFQQKRDIPKDLGLDEKIQKHTKKKKRPRAKKGQVIKKNFVWGNEFCPFCKAELPIDEKELQRLKEEDWKEPNLVRPFRFGKYPRNKECECGAREVSGCPCCNRKTWYKDGIYRHQKIYSSCTFEGPKKYKQGDKNGKT